MNTKPVSTDSAPRKESSHQKPPQGMADANKKATQDSNNAVKNPEQDCDMVTALDDESLSQRELAFLEAARCNNCEMLSKIMEQRKFNVNTCTNLNRTAMHLAAGNGHLQVIQILLRHKAKIDVQDKHGMSPLFWAAHNDHVDVTQYLIENGANVSRCTKRGYSLLHVLAKADAIRTMEALLRNQTITNLTSRDKSEMTPLMLASFSGSSRVTKVLSILNSIEDHVDELGRNVFHLAVLSKSPETVDVLCQHPFANKLFNNFDSNDMAPLHYAVDGGDYSCTEVLLSYKVDQNIRSKNVPSPIVTAALKGDTAMVTLLVTFKASIKKSNAAGNTALHISAMANHAETAIEILNCGADISTLNNRYQTALNAAVEQGSVDATEILLLAGSDSDQVDRTAKTPLKMASQSGFVRIVDMLIKAERWRLQCPMQAHLIAIGLRGTVESDIQISEDSLSEAETFTGSLSESEIQQRLLESKRRDSSDLREFHASEHITDEEQSICETASYLNSTYNEESKLCSSHGGNILSIGKTGILDIESIADVAKQGVSPIKSDYRTDVSGCGISAMKSDVSHNSSYKFSRKKDVFNKNIYDSPIYKKSDNEYESSDNDERKEDVENGNEKMESPYGVGVVNEENKKDGGELEVNGENCFRGRERYRCTLNNECDEYTNESEYEQASRVKDSTVVGPTRPKFSLLNFNEPNAVKFQLLLYYIAYNKFKPDDWRKLAFYWKFTEEHIEAISMNHANSGTAYKDHGFRMMSIWLHGLPSEEDPNMSLYAGLVAIGRKQCADKMERDYQRAVRGKSKKKRFRLPHFPKQSFLSIK